MNEGNGLLRAEVDRIGQRLRDGVASNRDLDAIDDWRLEKARAAIPVIEEVKNWGRAPMRIRTCKSVRAISDKLRREGGRLSTMTDVAGCRVVVPDLADQNWLVSQLQMRLPGSQKIDLRREPANGYRAVHLVVPTSKGPVEVQVRTRLQDRWAQALEGLARVHGAQLLRGGGPTHVRHELLVASHELDSVERLVARRRRALAGLTVDQMRALEMPLRFRAAQKMRRLDGLSKEGKKL